MSQDQATEEPTQEEKMKRAYRDALQCQSACNLSGVLHSFDRHMTTICREPGLGTDDRNTHPVVKMFLSKLLSLAGMNDGGDFGDADEKCCEGAGMTMEEYRKTF